MSTVRKHRISLLSSLLLALIAFLAIPRPAQAQRIGAGDTIPAGQVVENDVLLTGTDVTIDGTVLGDVIAIGTTLTINGSIEGSLIAVGATGTVNGEIGGSVYLAGRTLVLGPSANVQGNVHFVGLLLDSRAGSQVSRDLVVGALRAQVSGEIGRALRALILLLNFDGKIGYSLTGAIQESEPGTPPSGGTPPRVPGASLPSSRLLFVSLGPGKAPGDAALARASLFPLALSTKEDTRTVAGILPEWLVLRLGEFVALLLVGGLAVWLVPGRLGLFTEKLRAKPLPSLGYGLLGLAIFANAIAIAILLSIMILFIGIWLGGVSLWSLAFLFWGIAYSILLFVLSAFALTVFFGSKVVIAYLAGCLILGRLAPKVARYRFLLLLFGAVLYILLRSIPTVGWVIELLIVVFGVGAIWVAWRDGRVTPETVERPVE